MLASTRADPMSHGLGSSKGWPGRCSARKRSASSESAVTADTVSQGWYEPGTQARVATPRGLALDGMRGYCAPGITHPEAIVTGYGTPPAHSFTAAVARLCAVLSPSGPGRAQRGE